MGSGNLERAASPPGIRKHRVTCAGWAVVASGVNPPVVKLPRQHTISTVTSTQRRISPPSRRPLHQTTAPSPTTVMNGENVRKILSGSSKNGANSVTKTSILNSAVDHGTAIVEEPMRCLRTEGEGMRRVTNLAPSRVTKEVL